MAQLVAPGARRRNPSTMRSERVVSLRQNLPRGYVTVRKDIPVYLTETATPKVDATQKRADETATGKGVEAR